MEVKIAMKTDWEEAIHYCTRDILYGAALYCTVLGKLFICFFVCEHGRYPPSLVQIFVRTRHVDTSIVSFAAITAI
jgi:hypothetical protein